MARSLPQLQTEERISPETISAQTLTLTFQPHDLWGSRRLLRQMPHLWDFVTVAERPKTGALSPDKHLLVTWRLPTPEEGASLSRRMGRRHHRLRPTTFLQWPLLPPCLSPFTTLSSHRGPKPRWFSALAVLGSHPRSSCRNSNETASLFDKRCSPVAAKGTQLWPCPASDSLLPLPIGSQNLASVPPLQAPGLCLNQVTALTARLSCSPLVPVSLSCPPEVPASILLVVFPVSSRSHVLALFPFQCYLLAPSQV